MLHLSVQQTYLNFFLLVHIIFFFIENNCEPNYCKLENIASVNY